MKTVKATMLFLLALNPTSEAASLGALEPGAYEIQMRLELPHLEDMNVSKTSIVCLTDGPSHGLVVLSDNNPLAKCPISNVRQAGNSLTFDIICQGENQGIASAQFTLSGDSFSGAFEMKMGGKNMTMTERQTGHRIGACPDLPRS
jgi:hypothetical protein